MSIQLTTLHLFKCYAIASNNNQCTYISLYQLRYSFVGRYELLLSTGSEFNLFTLVFKGITCLVRAPIDY